MFVPSTSETRTKLPEAFTKKARVEVFNNLASSASSSASLSTTTNNITSNNNTTRNNDDSSSFNELMKTPSPTPDVARPRIKSSILPSFFNRDTKQHNNNASNKDHDTATNNNDTNSLLPLSPSSTVHSNASSLRSQVYFTSAVPGYQQFNTPIKRTFTNNSIESTSGTSSIFSSSSLKSVSTNNSSILADEASTYEEFSHPEKTRKITLPSISNILKSSNTTTTTSAITASPSSSLPSLSPAPYHTEQSSFSVPQQVSIMSAPTHRHNSSVSTISTIRRDQGKTISLEKAISDIKDMNLLTHRNIGYEVFTQLNEAIAHILKNENLQLIDWNLNLIRCCLIVTEIPKSWDNEIPEITVNGNRRYKIQDGFQSELVKLIASYRRQQKNYVPKNDLNFRKFIKSVMQNRFLVYDKKKASAAASTTAAAASAAAAGNSSSSSSSDAGKKLNEELVIKFNKNIKEELIRIQLIPDDCTEEEFIEFLTNSDLFKEFNLEKEFRHKVATISIKQSTFLQSTSSTTTTTANSSANTTGASSPVSDGHGSTTFSSRSSHPSQPQQKLLFPYKILSLRNYFLNLLVASQTLFEFHYTINELLAKDENDNTANSEQELKWLWDNIRERNFKKIEVFDRIY